MILAEFYDLLRRRWYIYGVVAAVTLATVMFLISAPRVYSAQAEVAFFPAEDVVATMPWASYIETTMSYTAAVDRLYSDTFPTTELSSPGASLFGNGIRDGIAVGISTVGSQWRSSVDRPVIVVKVNAASPTEARTELKTAMERLDALSTQMQNDVGVPGSLHIQTTWDESEVMSEFIGPTGTGAVKGGAVLVGASLLFATLIAVAVDVAQGRYRQSLSRTPESRHPRNSHKPTLTPTSDVLVHRVGRS